mgnify:CR=1 FL=1
MEKNLTTGSVFKAILTFALPYLLSYFLQTLYGMADLYITGRFCGVDSITAVANGSQVMHMVTVMLVGLAMGITVGIGHAVGAGENRRAGSTIGNGAVLFLVLSAALAALLAGAPAALAEGTGALRLSRKAAPPTTRQTTAVSPATRRMARLRRRRRTSARVRRRWVGRCCWSITSLLSCQRPCLLRRAGRSLLA